MGEMRGDALTVSLTLRQKAGEWQHGHVDPLVGRFALLPLFLSRPRFTPPVGTFSHSSLDLFLGILAYSYCRKAIWFEG